MNSIDVRLLEQLQKKTQKPVADVIDNLINIYLTREIFLY